MPAFGNVLTPVRNLPDTPIEVNYPDGFMLDPPGEHWYIGLWSDWQTLVPPAVTRATAVICNPLVRMPWIVRRPDGSQLRPGDAGYPPWLTDPMLLNGSTGGPNTGIFPALDRVDRFDLWARWVSLALWHGVAPLLFTPDADGQPRAGTVHVLHPDRIYRGQDGGWALATRGGGLEPIDDAGMIGGQRVLLLRHSLPGGVFGRHRAQLKLAGRVTSYAAESLDMSVPSGVLTTEQPISQAQSDAARDQWEATQRRRRIAVLGNGAKYQQVTMTPQQAELVAMARLSNEQVAHMFELPAAYLDANTNSLTYSNAQDNRQDLVDGPLASWSARVEETLASVLPWGWSLTVDFTRYTMPTTQTEGA